MADASRDHGTHDLEAIAALADERDAAADGRPSTTPECPDCAALLDDLRLLSHADAARLVPVRTRDFRLDPAQAARLAAMGPEPERGPGRLGGEMIAPAPDHATHDPELVAAHLDGRLDPGDLERVDAWLAACGACAVLHEDLQDLVLATRALPTPSRPRDFALSPEDADRARSGGWRRLVAAIGSPRDTFSRPLAVGLTTLGIAGLLVANVPSTLTFGSAGSTTGSAAQMELAAPSAGAAAAGASAAPLYQPNGIDTIGGEPPVDTTAEGPVEPSRASAPSDAAITKSAEPDQRDGSNEAFAQTVPDETNGGPSWLVLGSLALLVVGLTLALLRWRARRLGDG